MNLAFSPSEEAFRLELRHWLERHSPQDPDPPMAETLAEEVSRLRRWQLQLHRDGWVGVHWPCQYGGRGASIVENYIFQEEMARAQAPEIIGRIGVNLVGPTLMTHGTEAQRQAYLPRILSGEHLWCQLFSEPGAGSDLTALRCRAEADGDAFIVNGEKVWTSYAQFADWGILLARTHPDAPKAKGISFLLVDMRSPGITVRPLRQLTGSEEFNQVFFDQVRVPRSHLVGELDRGWQIASTTLSHERGTSARQLIIHRMLLQRFLELARDRASAHPSMVSNAVARQCAAQACIEVHLLKLHNWRVLTEIQRTGSPGRESSIVKLFWSEMSQRMHDAAMALLGEDGVCGDDPAAARWQRSFLYYRGATLWAGTSEIQRNIIAQRMLGLPRES